MLLLIVESVMVSEEPQCPIPPPALSASPPGAELSMTSTVVKVSAPPFRMPELSPPVTRKFCNVSVVPGDDVILASSPSSTPSMIVSIGSAPWPTIVTVLPAGMETRCTFRQAPPPYRRSARR